MSLKTRSKTIYIATVKPMLVNNILDFFLSPMINMAAIINKKEDKRNPKMGSNMPKAIKIPKRIKTFFNPSLLMFIGEGAPDFIKIV